MEVAEQLAERDLRDAEARVAHGQTHLASRFVERQDHLAAIGELERVGEEVQEDLTHALRVAHHVDRGVRHVDAKLEILAAAQAIHLRGARARQLRQVHRGEADLEAAGLGLGQVEHVVDERQEVLAVALDPLQRLARPCAQVLLRRRHEEIGEAEDGAERRPKLVAHGGEELGLHLYGAGQALPLFGQHDALLAEAVVRPRVVEAHAQLPRGVPRRALALAPERRQAADEECSGRLVAERDRLGEHPAQGGAREAEIEHRRRVPQLVVAEKRGFASDHDRSREALAGEERMVDDAPVAGEGVHRHEEVSAVLQVHHADVPLGDVEQPLQPGGGEGPDVERPQLAHEGGVGAGHGVTRGEARVGGGELGQRPLAVGERAAQAGVLLHQEARDPEEARADRPQLVTTRVEGRERLQLAGRVERAFELVGGVGHVARDPDAAREREDDGQHQDARRHPARRRGRLEGGALARGRRVERLLPEIGDDAAHLVGACLSLGGHLLIDGACLACADLWLADRRDPVADQAGEGVDPLVLHPVLGGGLRLGEHRLEVVAGVLVRHQERAVPGEQVAALARLEISHQAEEDLGVVRQLEVVLHQALELALQLLVRLGGALQTDPEHADDEQRAEEDAPEECTREELQSAKLRTRHAARRARSA